MNEVSIVLGIIIVSIILVMAGVYLINPHLLKDNKKPQSSNMSNQPRLEKEDDANKEDANREDTNQEDANKEDVESLMLDLDAIEMPVMEDDKKLIKLKRNNTVNLLTTSHHGGRKKRSMPAKHYASAKHLISGLETDNCRTESPRSLSKNTGNIAEKRSTKSLIYHPPGVVYEDADVPIGPDYWKTNSLSGHARNVPSHIPDTD